MRAPAARSPRWLLVVGAPPAGVTPTRLRDAVRAGIAARCTAPDGEPDDHGIDGRGTALEER
ncbi:MAG TPA: hypothetical protein VHG93_06000 [Longimicrobium sp.]|nr:hypothetical protein [Longimicrobium sp.]